MNTMFQGRHFTESETLIIVGLVEGVGQLQRDENRGGTK